MPIDDIVNPTPESDEDKYNKQNDLAAWVRAKVDEWETTRDSNYETRWARYERLWRGLWSADDVQRMSERSKLISPALSQAIESIVAEIEEAVFGAGRFFDVDPSLTNEDAQAVLIMRDLLFEDMLKSDIKSAISEIVLNGAIYGTGIGKIVLETVTNKYITPKPVNGLPDVVEAGRTEDEEVVVRLVAVHPSEFVIDDGAKNLRDALGMAHVTLVPLHIIEQRQDEGVYDECEVEPFMGTIKLNDNDSKSPTGTNARLIEYHGLVPVDKLARYVLGEDYDDVVDEEDMDDEDDYVEAIVTITDKGDILRAIPNPNTLQDRNFLSFQFDTLPNSFYGRGVAEKGLNAQMALDSELRARQDGMALAIHPMLAADANMMPKGGDLRVRPGRTLLTNGDPRQALLPINFGQLGTDTFTQSADLERQVAKATGALDDAAMNPSYAKTGAMGMAMSGAIKRSMRTLANIERNLITPMVHKFAFRYMQYAPDRYPVIANPKFKVETTQGIMAKEMEQMQLGNMLKTVTPDSPAYWMLLKGIFQNSSIKNREEFDQIIGSQLESALNPQPSPMEVATMQAQEAKLKIDMARARAELLRIELEAQKLETGNLKTYTEAMLNIAKAESEEAGNQIQQYNAILSRIKTQFDVNMKKAERDQVAQQMPQEIPNIPQQ